MSRKPRRSFRLRRAGLTLAIGGGMVLGTTFGLAPANASTVNSASFGVAASAVPMDPPWSHALRITNIGTTSMHICNSWKYPPNVTHSPKCPSATGTLYYYENSKKKYGWADTDAAYLYVNTKLMRRSVGVHGETYNTTEVGCNKTGIGQYWKVSPGPTSHDKNYYLAKC